MANEAVRNIRPAVVVTERVLASHAGTARLMGLKASFALERLRVRDQGRSYRVRGPEGATQRLSPRRTTVNAMPEASPRTNYSDQRLTQWHCLVLW